LCVCEEKIPIKRKIGESGGIHEERQEGYWIETESKKDRKTGIQTDRHTYIHMTDGDRQKDRDGQTIRQTVREIETDGQTDRKR
jgi:hypothetical protein